MSQLKDKTALITGGNSGIGFATAKLFIEEGAEVVITGRNQETLDKAAKELGAKVLAVKSDVSNLSELDSLFSTIKEKFGILDVLFANAGIAKIAPLEEVTESHFDQHFNINVKGLFFTVQKALPMLSDGASVILNASIVKDKGFAGMSVYTATKAAVRSFARTWTSELAPRGIRVNSISPGPIETPIYERMDMPKDQMDEFAGSIAEQVPLGRFGKPEDIAQAALYLASDASRYAAAIDLVVDGGLSHV